MLPMSSAIALQISPTLREHPLPFADHNCQSFILTRVYYVSRVLVNKKHERDEDREEPVGKAAKKK